MRVVVALLLAAIVGLAGAETNAPAPLPVNVRSAKALPAFSLAGLDGTPVSSASFTGKTVLVWFFTSWDKPSRRQAPVLQELVREFGTNNVTALGVSLDTQGPEPVRQFAKEYALQFPIAMAEMQFIIDSGGLDAVPTTLVVEPRGNIISRYVGVTEANVIAADIRGILNQTKD